MWLDAESTMWNQRSRNTWLVSRDRNIGFFHAKASHLFQHNTIKGLCDVAGVWQEEDQIMEDITSTQSFNPMAEPRQLGL